MRAELTYAAQKTIEPQHNKLSDVIKYEILLVVLSFQWIFYHYNEANLVTSKTIPVTAKQLSSCSQVSMCIYYLTVKNVNYHQWKHFDKPYSKTALMFWLIVLPWAASTRQAQGQRADSMQTDQPYGCALLTVQERSIIFNLFKVPCIHMANYSWAIKGIILVCVCLCVLFLNTLLSKHY